MLQLCWAALVSSGDLVNGQYWEVWVWMLTPGLLSFFAGMFILQPIFQIEGIFLPPLCDSVANKANLAFIHENFPNVVLLQVNEFWK